MLPATLISLMYNSLRLRSENYMNKYIYLPSLSLIILLLLACGPKKKVVYEVTGKGNGGNAITVSKKDINEKVNDSRPGLEKLFQGLKYMYLAEQAVPESTDLSEFNDLNKILKKMFFPKNENKDIFFDISSENNIVSQTDYCVDSSGVANIAVAIPGDIGGEICISLDGLRRISPKNAGASVDIQLYSILAHEFGHHFLNGKNPEDDENLLRTFQAFIDYELHRAHQTSNDDSSVTTPDDFLDKFLLEQQTSYEQALKSKELREKKR